MCIVVGVSRRSRCDVNWEEIVLQRSDQEPPFGGDATNSRHVRAGKSMPEG
jgi:hypothetical protein